MRECDDADVLFIVAADRKATVPSITHSDTDLNADVVAVPLYSPHDNYFKAGGYE